MDDEAGGRSEEELAERMIDLLRELPTGAVIEWGPEGAGDASFVAAWCDVWAPEIARPLNLSWIWTIDSPASIERKEPGASPAPLNVIVPPDGRDEAGEEGWAPTTISRVLEEWVAERTGRSDLRFEYDPELLSDWLRAVVEHDGFSTPMTEAPDGSLHELAEGGTDLWTRCGLPVASEWRLVSGDYALGDDDEFLGDVDRFCDACSPAADDHT